jgi:ketol-acid reductoisomerase
MRAHVYTESDAESTLLGGATVAVLGYGNQGAAQALNLRDSGVSNLLVGNREDDYLTRATSDGFDTRPIAEAARAGDVLLLLIPDEVQPEVFAGQIAPGLSPGDTLVIASGYNVAFRMLDVPDGVDIVMVAPRMIGAAVRSRYVDGTGFPCFVSAERDASGHAMDTALAVAKAIGGIRGGAIASSAREEAALDPFSEQAIWPAILAVLRSAYEVLHAGGFSDEAVLYETYLSGEAAEVFEHAARDGLLDQLKVHSQTSQYGQLRGLLGLDTGELARRFARVLNEDILSGSFAAEWSAVSVDAERRIGELAARAREHPLAAAERAVLSTKRG